MKALLSGNEAIARGAYEFGVKVAAAYPGTPSTEILEALKEYPGVYAQWSTNEKVALEVGIGAAIAGARALVAMKHVGVNVAADPLFTVSYTGINAGLVLVSADDPGMHSSQNEQDNRHYARAAKIPAFEPSDSQEAKDFMGIALQLSEEYDTPVMLRTTTRVSHSRTLVGLGEPRELVRRAYKKDTRKYVMIPAYARARHVVVEERLKRLKQYADECPVNRIEWGDTEVGIVTSGICYQYVKEALPEVSCLKLGLVYPLPERLLREFASSVKRLYVVEELDPFIEEQIRALGIEVVGKELFPSVGELNPGIVAEKLGRAESRPGSWPATGRSIPGRPPVLCPGCPHRAVFYVLKQLNLTVTGDIGCYTLGTLPPLESMDTCICMGASIGAGLGMEKADPALKSRLVSVIGDSTFLHSGITSLLDLVYNQGSTVVIILDNGTTAMTGHQDHPATGRTLGGAPTHQVDLAELVKALGVRRVATVDPFDLDGFKQRVREELASPEPSVIIARRECVLLCKQQAPPVVIDDSRCTGCRVCMRLGCPALVYRNGVVEVNAALCTGCGVCAQTCRFDAIVEGERLAG